MSDRMMFQSKKGASSNFTNPSLVLPTSPTLASPTRGFSSPKADTVLLKTQEIQSNTEQPQQEETLKLQAPGHDIGRISLRPQARSELTIQRDGVSSLPPVPNYQLTPPSLLQPPDAATRYGLGQDLHFQLDPQLQLMAMQYAQQQVSLTNIQPVLTQLNLRTLPTSVSSPSVAGTPTPNPFTTTMPPPSPLLVPAGAGPDTPREATTGDLLKAVVAIPSVDNAIVSLQSQVSDRISQDWQRLRTGEQIGVASSLAIISGGVLAGVFTDPTAQQLALSQLNGRVLPVPGLNWLRLEMNTEKDGLMLGLHVDVGRLLPPNLGFGSASISPIGRAPQPEPFVPSPPPIQRKASDSVTSLDNDIGERIQAALGSGSSLNPNTQQHLEKNLGADLSGVRIHTDSQADRLTRDVNAVAFTTGQDIFFSAGSYNPNSLEGKHLLTHELVHTIQQAASPVTGKPTSEGITISDPSDQFEQEAEQVADIVIHTPISSKVYPDRSFNNISAAPKIQTKQTTANLIVQRDQPAAEPTSSQTTNQPATSLSLDDVTAIMHVMPELNAFVAVVEAELAQWRNYRNSFVGDIPGQTAYASAKQLKETLKSKASNPAATPTTSEGQPIIAYVKDPYNPRIRSYLNRKLSGENLFLLREMVSFGLNSQGLPTFGNLDLADFFNITPAYIRHNYICKVVFMASFKYGAFLTGGVNFRLVEIQYSNELGMTYFKELRLYSGMGGGGGSYAEKASPGESPEGKPGSGGRKFAASGESESKTQEAIFWRPQDFEGGFMAGKVGIGASGSVGPLSVKVAELKILQFIMFTEEGRGNILFDMMNGQTVKVSGPGLLSPQFGGETKDYDTEKTGYGFSANAGVELEAGYGYGGDLKASAAEIPNPQVEKAKADAQQPKASTDWSLLRMCSIFFATGSAELDAMANSKIKTLAEIIQQFIQQNPECDLRFEIVGNASPRWRHPQNGQIPLYLNQTLSENRALKTLEQIRSLSIGGNGSREFNTQACPGPDMLLDDSSTDTIVKGQGALEAIAEGAESADNSAHYRRADISVYKRLPASIADQSTSNATE